MTRKVGLCGWTIGAERYAWSGHRQARRHARRRSSKKKLKEAKVDLEAFIAAASPLLEFAKQQANKMLLDIAAKKIR